MALTLLKFLCQLINVMVKDETLVFTTNCCHSLSSIKSALFLKIGFHLAAF